ncbi:hypothetical protein QTH90_28315 [Variovorax sp. J2P1-59]|uniref:hypothetical protein n=1 Tax=Variovorax flavidus TaxID=3053501 RepID=UPI0025758EF8|nr:hypothetical protein [Variovorax sp. J2P1-59]MDM0078341.1 hypothetical protein [Variovorax sp. J2P1-59]
MADPRQDSSVSHLATRRYAPQPVRSIAARAATSVVLCAACLAGGAAAAMWHVQRDATDAAPCAPLPSEDLVRAELERTKLALAQEAAARTALQKTATASAAEVSRLDTELRFLRGQRPKR